MTEKPRLAKIVIISFDKYYKYGVCIVFAGLRLKDVVKMIVYAFNIVYSINNLDLGHFFFGGGGLYRKFPLIKW